MEMFAVKVFCPDETTGQLVKPLGILVVEAFDEISALVSAVKLCAQYYYEDMKYNQENRIPNWLLKYFRTDFAYGSGFRGLSYKVLS